MAEPPPFQEAAGCVVCHASFTTFKRRHHCRACGRSFCNEHSANQKALPQYGLYTPVRVCDECYNPPKLSTPHVRAVPTATVTSNRAQFAKLALDPDAGADGDVDVSSRADGSIRVSTEPSFECVCGMPLCICEKPSVSKAASSNSPPQEASRKSREPRRAPISNSSHLKQSDLSSTGNTMPSLFFSSAGGKSSQGPGHPLSKSYDLSGEGIREAVKNGDVSGVRELLSKGVDVNYVDKQGMSLIHLAAMFNFTEITFILMDGGAKVDAKNTQGETALDCAQPTLAHKMRGRIESSLIK